MSDLGNTVPAWNGFQTDTEVGVVARVDLFPGAEGDQIHAYVARPLTDFSRGGVVLIHHMPGWDEFYFETAERLARHGYDVIAFDTYCRDGHGLAEDVATKVRAAGGPTDERIVADATAAAEWLRTLPTNNGKVAIMGSCSGGRYALLTASINPKVCDAVVDLWGGMVIMSADELTPQRPVAPIDYTAQLEAPLLGLFGNDDQRPSPQQVDIHAAELAKHGKTFEFHRYDGAGHGFFYYDKALYRHEQAIDGWNKIFDFLSRYLRS